LNRTLGTDTVIGTGVQIKGDFKAPANVELRGTVEGNLEVDGLFAIRESGRLIGSVTASDVVVEVEGEIAATEKVEISSTGRVQGDVQAKVVCIADGAFLQGKVQMANGESAASKNKKDVAYATAGAALR
jgi:cytoskeletal protein CcmA (bactofilin family)